MRDAETCVRKLAALTLVKHATVSEPAIGAVPANLPASRQHCPISMGDTTTMKESDFDAEVSGRCYSTFHSVCQLSGLLQPRHPRGVYCASVWPLMFVSEHSRFYVFKLADCSVLVPDTSHAEHQATTSLIKYVQWNNHIMRLILALTPV